jgi:hypothetical protein
MEHQSLEAIARKAKIVRFDAESRRLRRHRIERWAMLIERYRGPLRPLFRVESFDMKQRQDLRDDASPVNVAFQDPVLRSEGLTGDRLGDAQAFFGLSDGEAHYLLCDCHYNGSMTSVMVAARLRSVSQRIFVAEMMAEAGGAVVRAFAALFGRQGARRI